MISSAIQNFDAWWIGVFPGLAILTVVLAFNFIGDSLRDILDPVSGGAREVGGVAPIAPTEASHAPQTPTPGATA
jgi:peptide/nickel transport system permease protein